MGDFNLHGEISRVHSVGSHDAVGVSILADQYFSFKLADDIFSHLLTLTSYISHQWIQFIEDLVFRDVSRCSEDFDVVSSGQDPISSNYSNCTSVSVGCLSSSRSNHASTGLGVPERGTSNHEEHLLVYSRSESVERNCIHGGTCCIFKGSLLPLLRSAWKLVLASCRFLLYYVRGAQARMKSIISRVRKTLHGSSDDIGWMQRASGMDPVEDGSTRFLELLQAIRNGEHKLPDSYVYLLIPGLFSNHGPLYFVSTKKFFSKMGLACHIAKIHSEASVEHNSWVLKQYIDELYWGSGKRVMLFGHSKGGVDAAAALSLYWSDLKDKVAGLALVQSPYGGTPIASDILREGQIADKETRRIMELVICRLIKGDMKALEDLTYERRKEFIMKHKLPKNIPLISFHSEASIGLGVISTMTHIAHAELPWFPSMGLRSEDMVEESRKVPVVVPISAAMALSALHLQLRYGEKSDGLVMCHDAEVPGSVVVRPDRKLDHAWMVYSSWKKDPIEPDAREMCEALLTMLVELGDAKRAEEE